MFVAIKKTKTRILYFRLNIIQKIIIYFTIRFGHVDDNEDDNDFDNV